MQRHFSSRSAFAVLLSFAFTFLVTNPADAACQTFAPSNSPFSFQSAKCDDDVPVSAPAPQQPVESKPSQPSTPDSTTPSPAPSPAPTTSQPSPSPTQNQSSQSPSATPAVSSPQRSQPPVSGMVLTFDDEFNSLNASSSGLNTLWQTRFWYNDLLNSNGSSLDLDPAVCNLGLTPYSISNSILTIRAQTTDSRLHNCGVRYQYTGGNLYSYQSFSQQYGYFETRFKASDVRGTWFSFWMLPKDGSWPPEIDGPEILGIAPTIDNVSNHTGRNDDFVSYHVDTGANLADDFHTYGILWDPSNITYYFDGEVVAKTSTQADEHKPFYLIIGLGVGGNCNDGWAGCPSNPSAFSATTQIDYVRAWQFSNMSPQSCVGDCN